MAVQKLASIALCAGVFVTTACSQPAGTSAISGLVIDSESGGAVRKAIVTLTLQSTPRQWATARTDGSGRFQFDHLPAGKYDLRATKANEGTAVYGARSVRELGDFLILADGESLGPITLRLLRSATVSGHVYDSEGDPVAGVTMNLMRQGRNLGAPVLVNYRGAPTDDRGEFRITNVDPGHYYLRALPQPRFNSHNILVGQFYGGAQEWKDAGPLQVRGGETLTGLDFHLTSEQAFEVHGRVAGVPSEILPSETQPPTPNRIRAVPEASDIGAVQVTFRPADPGPFWSTNAFAQAPDYQFQLADVPPGRYRVEARLQSANKSYGASQVVDLRFGSGDVALTLAPAVEIHGTFRMEGQPPPANGPTGPRPDGSGIRIQLSRPGGRNMPQDNLLIQPGAGGRFSLPQVTPGEWLLSVTPVPPGFLKSAQFGDKDVRFSTFEVGAREDAALNIVVSMRTATVEGEVDAGPASDKRAGIVIAPQGPYHDLARFYYGVAADEEGKFKLNGIAPGKYKIFALEKMAAANFRNPEAIDQLEGLGEAIDIAEGATVEVHPKLIPSDRAAKALE